MIPTQTFEDYPIFGSNATKIEPGDAKKSAGFQQADVLPYEWMNWAWNKNSKGISDLDNGVASIERELNNVLSEANISPSGSDNNQLYKALRQNCGCIITSTTTITNAPSIESGNVVKIMFTADIAGVDTSTGFLISYNGQNIPVRVYKDTLSGMTLEDFTAAKVSWEDTSASYKFLDKGTTLELVYDSVQFIIINNPVVLQSVRYSIHADGTVDGGHLGLTAISFTDTTDYGWLALEHQSLLRADYPRFFRYWSTHKIGNSTLLEIFGAADSDHFYLPDTRESALVGAGQNASDSIATHDVYTVGQFKDDQLQNHSHDILNTTSGTDMQVSIGLSTSSAGLGGTVLMSTTGFDNRYSSLFIGPVGGYYGGRVGYTTRTKQKGVKYIIKVL